MATTKKKADTAHEPFDLAAFLERVADDDVFHERVIEREHGRKPLTITVRDLNIRQTNAIPYGPRVPLTDAFTVIAPYVTAWDLELRDKQSGKTIPVPPPAEAGPEVFELVDTATGAAIVSWLKAPHVMMAVAEKKDTASNPD